jgi:hypothetical protein
MADWADPVNISSCMLLMLLDNGASGSAYLPRVPLQVAASIFNNVRTKENIKAALTQVYR